jgi:hypothetical protein
MSELGKKWATTTTTDIGPLLNLLIFCNYFKIQDASLKAVKDWRNNWAHASDLTLNDIDKQNAFKDIECLMNDAELVGIKEVQDCRPSIKKVETADFLVLQDNELKIIQEFRLIQEYKKSREISESEVSEEDIRVLEKFDKLVIVVDKMGSIFLAILLFAISPLSRKVLGMLMFLVYFMVYPVGDRTVISDYGNMDFEINP